MLKAKRILPVVVGGTGFYLKALLEGLSPAPGRDERLRSRLRRIQRRRPLALHRFLRRHDPDAARRIHANDYQKLSRAVELTLAAGCPATITQRLPRNALTGFHTLKFGLAPMRDLLYERINQRTVHMFNNGLIPETKRILETGVSPTPRPLESLGYKQALDVITNRSDISQAIRECQAKTRQYAKRQITWFRREPDVQWLPGFGSEKRIQQQAVDLTRKFLLG